MIDWTLPDTPIPVQSGTGKNGIDGVTSHSSKLKNWRESAGKC